MKPEDKDKSKDLKLEVEELEEKIAPLADSSDVHLQMALVFAL